MGNCVGSKGVKKDPKILTEEEIKVLLDNTNLTRSQIVALHQNFLKECPSGKLTKKDFVKLFKEVHPSESKNEKADKFCEYVFKVIDTNNLGYISFQDFVVCFSLTSHGDFNKKCEFAFKLYDLDRDGIISKKEMTQVLTALYDLSGITDRKGDNAPAKKVDDIIRKINAKSHDPEVIAALEAEAKKREKKPAASKAPKEKKTKEQIKEEKERQKAEKERAKQEKERKAKEAKEKKAREAEEKKKRAAENKAKGIKESKPAKEAKPKALKPLQYITKEQFIDACNTDETLKKLFVDSIFSQQADQSMLEAKVDDLAHKINIELPSVSVSGDKKLLSHKTISLNAPKVNVTTSNSSSSSHNNGPVDEAKIISTTTTRVTPADGSKSGETVTTTVSRVLPDGTVQTTEETVPAAGHNSDSDQTHYSEHTEYVNVTNNSSSNAADGGKHINVELSTDGIKVNQSDK